MAKRFTDTAKWDKKWFRKLGSRLRDLRQYILDKCDHAGVIEIDLETFEHFIGEAVTIEDVKKAFRDEINLIDDDKFFVPGFIEFQYKAKVDDLNPDNKVHQSVLNRLKSLGAIKTLTSPSQGAKDKDKDMDKDKDLDKDLDKVKAPIFDFDDLYNLYPRKEGKKAGLAKLKIKIKTEEDYQKCKTALFRYVDHLEKKGSGKEFVKKFDTFVNNWEDWAAEDAGQVVIDVKPQPKTKEQARTAQNYDLYQKSQRGEI